MSTARILIDRTEGTVLHYDIPKELEHRVFVGSRVRVPLRQAEVLGIVLSLHDHRPLIQSAQMKSILEVIDYRALRKQSLESRVSSWGTLPEEKPFISTAMMRLAHWMESYYCASLDTILRVMAPTTIRNNSLTAKKRTMVSLQREPTDFDLEKLARRAPQQNAILHLLLADGKSQSASTLLKKTKSSYSTLHALEKAGWILLEQEVVARDPFAGEELLPSSIPKLNAHQQHVLNILEQELQRVNALEESVLSLPFLLYGVTGSGKTEVYLRSMEKALALGKSVLILVPEIALTPQTVERFRSRLVESKEKPSIALLHSHLSEGERHDQWLRLYRGEARIVIGARSAIFAPLQHLGLIIVDEEHETSYKQEETPRYHARDVAVMRARYEGAVLVLGSATPSLESMHNVHLGKYRLLELPERADHQRLPLVRVIDQRLQGKQQGVSTVLSLLLRKAMEERLEREEQIILFLNRRGFSSSLLCPHCGVISSCPHCSLSLTFHRSTNQLLCHLCGHQQAPMTRCSYCQQEGILYAGVGTERVQAAVEKAFPQARSFRIDADTMRGKKSYQETFWRFRKKEIDILIGTQMIAKGLDFPNVTLVGIINADTSLHAPDFRAGERTFQLLTQVAGRAGRGDLQGEVMIQTYTPESPSIQFARHHDYQGFFDQEIALRQQFGYPPFEKMILIQLRGIHREEVADHAIKLKNHLRSQFSDSSAHGLRMGEPVPAPRERAHGYYRFHLALHHSSFKKMKPLLRQALLHWKASPSVIMTLDVDPQSLI